MTKYAAPDEPTPAQGKPGFQRRYGLDVQGLAIRLRSAGRSWNEVSREVGVSPSQVRRWVKAQERAEDARDQDTRAVAVRRSFEERRRMWLVAKLLRIAPILERSRDPKEISALRSAANVYYQAFRVMTMRFDGTGRDNDGLEEYQKFQDGQLAKEKARLDAMKRARAEATAAEPIEMTAERVEDGPSVGK